MNDIPDDDQSGFERAQMLAAQLANELNVLKERGYDVGARFAHRGAVIEPEVWASKTITLSLEDKRRD